jgi:hypothetical protein
MMGYREPQDGDLLKCGRCPMDMEVSPEDPDATLGDMLHHLRIRHGITGQQAAQAMRLVDKAGRTIE